MSVSIRLSRIGKKSKPEYRIIVTEKRHKNRGAAIEILGTVIPFVDPPKVKVNKNRLTYWQEHGAKLSKSVTFYLS
jgi:small subunit ribosomal protein S16